MGDKCASKYFLKNYLMLSKKTVDMKTDTSHDFIYSRIVNARELKLILE